MPPIPFLLATISFFSIHFTSSTKYLTYLSNYSIDYDL
ncbi:hypothetical protein OIU76_008909 [Salix suchowensis]|nr:hypothetical protein OIU76_008909 [Salix suchowensis]